MNTFERIPKGWEQYYSLPDFQKRWRRVKVYTYNEQYVEYVEPGEVFCRVYYLDGRVAEFRRPAPSLIAGNQHC